MVKRITIRKPRECLEFDDHINEIFIDFISSLRDKGFSCRTIAKIFFNTDVNWLLIFDRRSRSFLKEDKYKVSLSKKIQYLICAGYEFEIFVKKPSALFSGYPKTKSSKVKDPSLDL